MHTTPTPFSTRSTGIVLVLFSALLFSTAGIFTRSVTAGAWSIIFWRGLSGAGLTLGWLAVSGRLTRELRRFGMPALLATCLMASGTAAFIPAFKLGSVANVALIYASAPFIAAILSWTIIREAPSRKTLIASTAAFAGVLVIMWDSLGNHRLAGDILALVMTAMMAGAMVVYRARPRTVATLPSALSGIALLPLAIFFGNPFPAPSGELPILFLFGAVFALASITLLQGAKYLPSAETALISALEMPLAPVLAWAILAETPSPQVIAGGAIIGTAVLWSQTGKPAGSVPRPQNKDAARPVPGRRGDNM